MSVLAYCCNVLLLATRCYPVNPIRFAPQMISRKLLPKPLTQMAGSCARNYRLKIQIMVMVWNQ